MTHKYRPISGVPIGTSAFAFALLASSAIAPPAVVSQPTATGLEAQCTAEAAQAAAPAGVTVKPIKTANFMATLPANWNGKYLQFGCSGHCGQFYVSNPAMPTITVPAQGKASDIIERGYATFGTDEGHEGLDGASWAVRKDGSVDQDMIDDFFFRATKGLTRVGKEFTVAFYGKGRDDKRPISRSYFNGCSGGGRDAMVAASYFPNEFDGIIAGSPYEMIGMTFQGSAIGAAAGRPGGQLSPALLKIV